MEHDIDNRGRALGSAKGLLHNFGPQMA